MISGVFVPALQHLFTYKPPSPSTQLVLAGKCLSVCGDYTTAACLGYPVGFWWRFLVALAERFSSGPEYLSIPLGTSGRVHNCKIVFSYRNKVYGELACDRIGLSKKWWEGAGKSMNSFSTNWNLHSAVLVGRIRSGSSEVNTSVQTIIGNVEQ